MNKEFKTEETKELDIKVEKSSVGKPLKESVKKEKKKVKITKAKEITKEIKPKLISFDAFFAIMRSRNSKILDHHKGPMIAFLKQKGFKKLMATRKEFEDAFKDY